MITINDKDRIQDFLHVDFFPNSALIEMVNIDRVLFVIASRDDLVELAKEILRQYPEEIDQFDEAHRNYSEFVQSVVRELQRLTSPNL